MNFYPEESFISFIWKYQRFDKQFLSTVKNESIKILKPGSLNTDSGPDFAESIIEINGIKWSGAVELHVKSSEWYDHNHQSDPAYEAVILHVVWHNDRDVILRDGTAIPTIEIKDRVEMNVISNYKKLAKNISEIPCKSSLKAVDKLHIKSQLHKSAIERIKRKSEEVKNIFLERNQDWEETAFIFMAGTFGFNINKEPMLLLAKSVPFKILLQNRDNIQKIEALFFGMSSMLGGKSKGNYFNLLKSEFNFLTNKYKLIPRLTGVEWKFMRTRPDNFPVIRIAQLATYIKNYQHNFSRIIESKHRKEIEDIFDGAVSEYWQVHYMFGKERKRKNSKMGNHSITLLIINFVVPLKVAYGVEIDDHKYIEEGIELLDEIRAENNKIVRKMMSAGFPIDTALDSQAAIHQLKEYCYQNRCLSCDIGYQLLK